MIWIRLSLLGRVQKRLGSAHGLCCRLVTLELLKVLCVIEWHKASNPHLVEQPAAGNANAAQASKLNVSQLHQVKLQVFRDNHPRNG